VNGVQRVRTGAKVDPQEQAIPRNQALPMPDATAAKP
jgi:hypothetical protein